MKNAIEKGLSERAGKRDASALVREYAEDFVDALQAGSVVEPLATAKNQRGSLTTLAGNVEASR